ncbi:MAG: RidA family protein [Acidimicrobiales bacterium]
MTGDRQRVSSGTRYEEEVGYCRAVRVGPHVFVAGTAPQWPDGSVDPSIEVQARRCFEIIAGALEEAGSGLNDAVRTRIYLVDRADFDAVAKVHGELFAAIRPVNTTVMVAALMDDRWRMEIEVDAVIASATSSG